MKNTAYYIIAKKNNGKEIGWLSSGPEPSKVFNRLADAVTGQDKGQVVEELKKYIDYANKNISIGKADIVSVCNTMIEAVDADDCKFEIHDYSDDETTPVQAHKSANSNVVNLPFCPGDVVEAVEYDGAVISDDPGYKRVGDKFRVLYRRGEDDKVAISMYGMILCENLETGKVVSLSPLCLKLSMRSDKLDTIKRTFSGLVGNMLADAHEAMNAMKSGYLTERDVMNIVSDCIRNIQ